MKSSIMKSVMQILVCLCCSSIGTLDSTESPENTSTIVRVNPENLYSNCSTPNRPFNSSECCMGLYFYDDSDICIQRENCKYYIHYHDEGNGSSERLKYTMESTLNEPHYLAYGISIDDKMGHDIVIVCELTQALEASLYLMYNTPNKQNIKLEIPKKMMDKFITVTDINYANGKLQCQFDIAVRFTLISKNPSFNFTLKKGDPHRDKYFGLLATGKVVDGSLKYHREKYVTAFANNKWGYTNHCRLEVSLPKYTAQKVHVSLMVIMFMFFIPFTTLVTRFSKGDDKVIFKAMGPRWKCMHIFWGSAVLCLTISGFAAMLRRWQFFPAMNPLTTGHVLPGIVSYFLTFFQGFFAVSLLMVRDESSARILAKVHAWQSILTVNLGFVIIALAPYYTYHVMPCSISYVGFLWIIVYYVFEIAITVYYKKTDKLFGFNNRVICVYPLPIYPNIDSVYPGNDLRICARLLLLFFSLGFSAFIITGIFFTEAFGPPCYPEYKKEMLRLNRSQEIADMRSNNTQ